MDIELIANDIIENTQIDVNGLNDFLRMCDDYKNQLILNSLTRNVIDISKTDLPF
jgi:hypothetical protein